MFKWFYILLLCFMMMTGCKQNSAYNQLKVKEYKVEPWIRYENLLTLVDTLNPAEGLRKLELLYSEFTNIYFLRVINDQYQPDTSFQKIFSLYQKSPIIKDLYRNEVGKFGDLKQEEEDYSASFARLQAMIPGVKKPKVFTCLTEFGVGVFSTSDTVMGISLDLYLGKGNKYYNVEVWPAYVQHNMNKDNMVSNLLKNFIRNTLLPQREPKTLLDYMVQQGKEVYLLSRMIQPERDTLIYGYTKKQLNFCRENEKEMWSFFLSEKMVYSEDFKKIQKYVDIAPTSPGMPADSPGRTSAYLGGAIIEAYMKRHPDMPIHKMLQEINSQKILEEARYKP